MRIVDDDRNRTCRGRGGDRIDNGTELSEPLRAGLTLTDWSVQGRTGGRRAQLRDDELPRPQWRRHPTVGGAGSPCTPEPGRPCHRHGLVGQPRLADSRLAPDAHHDADTIARRGYSGRERRDLAFAADQRQRRDSARRETSIDRSGATIDVTVGRGHLSPFAPALGGVQLCSCGWTLLARVGTIRESRLGEPAADRSTLAVPATRCPNSDRSRCSTRRR